MMVTTLIAIIVLPAVFYFVSSGDYYGRKVSIQAPAFTLLDTDGKEHRLSYHQGKYAFLYFGYLHCDGVCHNQVGVMFNLNNHTDSDDLDFIFITMDPKRDSNESLKLYFNQLGKNFTALTADSMQTVQKIANKYNAPFFADGLVSKQQDYEIEHPGTLFLINPEGVIEFIYQNQFLRYDKMIEDLEKLRSLTTITE